MDDFDYSVQISELDWDAFFQACEECNMLPPGLAGLDDSGMSDMDDMASQQIQNATQTSDESELQTESHHVCEGSPVERYLSKYGFSSPDQVLSGSEDDFHLEAINVFFERLKSVSATADHKDLRSKTAGHSGGSDVKEVTKEIAASGGEISQPCTNQGAHCNDGHTYMCSDSTDDDRETLKSACPDTELFIREEDWSLDVLKDGDKWRTKMRSQPHQKIHPCNNLVNGQELGDANQVKDAKTRLGASKNSDLLVVQGQTFNVTPRRRRKKKKRSSVEMTETDPEYEAHLPRKESYSDEDTYGRRGEMCQETHMAEDCGSGTVSVVHNEFLVHPKENRISENYTVFSQSVSVKQDIRKATLVSPKLQEETSRSAVKVAQGKREIVRTSDSNPTEKPAETGQIAKRADLKSLEPDDSVTGTCHRDGNHHTKGDNAGNQLQLNADLPSEMPVSIASSAVPKMEKKLASIKKLKNVSHHTNDVKSQKENTALQPAPLILSHTLVGSKTPKNHLEDRVMLADFQLEEHSAEHQRKTSSSCLTLPELANKTLFSATYNNTKMKNSSSVTYDNLISHEHKNDANGSRSETFCSKLLPWADHTDHTQISQQNGHKTQETSAQIPKAEEIEVGVSLAQAKITDEHVSENAATFIGENNSPSSQINNVPESQNDRNMESVEILPPVMKVNENEQPSFEGQTKKFRPLIHITDPDGQLSDYSKCDSILSNEEQKGSDLYVDTPPCFSYEDHDRSPTIAVQNSPSISPESTDGAKCLESLDTDSVSQPTPPIFAISSFWNEMEKLTINDILRLRLVSQSQHPSVLLQTDDSNITDVTDAEDSGYFTHLDDAKPDHSSRNLSFISDLDGEIAQLPTLDADTLVNGTLGESPKPTGIIWESNPNLSGTSTGMEDVFDLDTGLSSTFFRNNSNHCFRKMCKNVSVQNLQTLEGQNLGQIIRNTSLNSIQSVDSTHSEVEDDYVDPFDRVESSSPAYLSDEDEADSSGITFSEIFEYLFGTEEPSQSASEANTVADTYLHGTETSVLDMYEHFFSEFEPESLFYPLTEDNTGTDEDLVPIFSSSRSATRNVQFPEVYDYFFPDDSPVHSDEDEGPEHTVIRVVTGYDHNPTKNHESLAASDPYKHNSWNFLWTNPFSFRRAQRTGSRVPCEESSSNTSALVNNSSRIFRRGIQPMNILGADESPFPDPLIVNLENRIFRKLSEQQKICSEMQTAVADPRLDAPLLPIKQADMCLVCIAFASWVLKSVNTQEAETWKAVLLANISALSAIRYLRRFTRDEAAKISPMRQIKPA